MPLAVRAVKRLRVPRDVANETTVLSTIGNPFSPKTRAVIAELSIPACNCGRADVTSIRLAAAGCRKDTRALSMVDPYHAIITAWPISVVDTSVIPVDGYARVIGFAEELFSKDISSATYIAFSSDKNIVGFQLNGSEDEMMLDGLPAM